MCERFPPSVVVPWRIPLIGGCVASPCGQRVGPLPEARAPVNDHPRVSVPHNARDTLTTAETQSVIAIVTTIIKTKDRTGSLTKRPGPGTSTDHQTVPSSPKDGRALSREALPQESCRSCVGTSLHHASSSRRAAIRCPTVQSTTRTLAWVGEPCTPPRTRKSRAPDRSPTPP